MNESFSRTIPMVCALLFVPIAAHADPKPMPFTYEQFEASVSHLDLEQCPSALPQENTFCRASIHHEEFHVFAFSYDGDSPLVGFKTYEAEGLEAILN
ncbi:hypothetical protein O2N63_10375 [Aliiroseovarius sp. KMU-50]|uniref:Uncharacterized protein n=1 Tax=Aliiroseovarius salicola TaxID=3009082 RepID=A0ABT4W1Y6_9RHOB|nr:hypothetical protein [Aliiroseovarius sp. KMU-50]MDA5094491.1 hypothetical protein [Aliiroseovarius sp. KMU-50]